MDNFVEAINGSWTTLHRLIVDTQTTPCGLKWHKKGNKRKKSVARNEVWIPNAVYFDAPKKCKICFKKKKRKIQRKIKILDWETDRKGLLREKAEILEPEVNNDRLQQDRGIRSSRRSLRQGRG